MIDMYDPNTWKPLFSTAIDLLERHQAIPDVDVFNMGCVLRKTACGTAACLFGSAALMAGYTNDKEDRTQVIKVFRNWHPSDAFMDDLKLLCNQTTFTAEDVVREYRNLELYYSNFEALVKALVEEEV